MPHPGIYLYRRRFSVFELLIVVPTVFILFLLRPFVTNGRRLSGLRLMPGRGYNFNLGTLMFQESAWGNKVLVLFIYVVTFTFRDLLNGP